MLEPIADVDLISLFGARLGVEKKHVIGLPAFEYVHVASRSGFFGEWFSILLGLQRNGRVEVVSAAVQGQRVPLVHILPGHANERPSALRVFLVARAVGRYSALPSVLVSRSELAVERDPITVFVAAPARPLCATTAVDRDRLRNGRTRIEFALWFKRRIFL